MKQPTSLSVTEFRTLIDALLAAGDDEMASAQRRLEQLRAGSMPPG